MQFFTTILHIVLCITLILIILLQPGKDGASVFGGGGGGGNQMYGPRGQGHFLGKATTVIAATFMFTSITLAFYSRPSDDGSSETLEAIREIEQAGTEVAVESQSEKSRIENLRTTGLEIDLEEAVSGEDAPSPTDDSNTLQDSIPNLLDTEGIGLDEPGQETGEGVTAPEIGPEVDPSTETQVTAEEPTVDSGKSEE